MLQKQHQMLSKSINGKLFKSTEDTTGGREAWYSRGSVEDPTSKGGRQEFLQMLGIVRVCAITLEPLEWRTYA